MKKQLHIYKHLGYFNEVADLMDLAQKSADEIVDYWAKGFGHFYEDKYNESETDLIAEEEDEAVKKNVTRFTKDGKYAITDGTWETWVKEHEDAEDSDTYIDIYELSVVQEYEEDVTYEVCPYCGAEVELDAELKVQRCPECGKHIVTCSMCLNEELNYPCKDCCLEILAHKLNEEENEE